MSDTTPRASKRNESEWVKQSVIEKAREYDTLVGSGAWLARPIEGIDRIDVYRFECSVDADTPGGDDQ